MWRSRTDRPKSKDEPSLNDSLCGHLNSAARGQIGWDILQFRSEKPDATHRGRKLDLIVSPTINVEIAGRLYSDQHTILPIECKRLPTPKRAGRDPREYVFSLTSTTGGIQRFKNGHHAADHSQALMIGYVQARTPKHWNGMTQRWIINLAFSGEPGWSLGDLLRATHVTTPKGLSAFESSHSRPRIATGIKLRHLWVDLVPRRQKG